MSQDKNHLVQGFFFQMEEIQKRREISHHYKNSIGGILKQLRKSMYPLLSFIPFVFLPIHERKWKRNVAKKNRETIRFSFYRLNVQNVSSQMRLKKCSLAYKRRMGPGQCTTDAGAYRMSWGRWVEVWGSHLEEGGQGPNQTQLSILPKQARLSDTSLCPRKWRSASVDVVTRGSHPLRGCCRAPRARRLPPAPFPKRPRRRGLRPTCTESPAAPLGCWRF